MKQGFQTFLDISTSHLTPEDAEIINNDRDLKSDGIVGTTGTSLTHYHAGVIVSTMSLTADNPSEIRDDKIAAMKADGFSDEFVALAVHAASEGGILLRFDQDAPVLDNFPTFDSGYRP